MVKTPHRQRKQQQTKTKTSSYQHTPLPKRPDIYQLWTFYGLEIFRENNFSVFLVVLDEFLLTSVQVWEKKSDLKNLTKS